MNKRRLIAAVSALLAVAVPGGSFAAAPSDPLQSRQWGLSSIDAPRAWATADGTGAVIAIVDSGVDLTHPDLVSKIVDIPGADLVEPQGECTGKGKARNCVQDGAQDENGHGTHVAGIAAAVTHNGIGVAGVAPGARILPIRVLDSQAQGTTGILAAGIRLAADEGADVINVSINYDPFGHVDSLQGIYKPVHDALAYASDKGAVVVISAGNDRLPLCSEPSSLDVLCVGALDRSDSPAWYSNHDGVGARNFLVAPGGQDLNDCDEDIVSTYLRDRFSTCGPDGYSTLSGTSMAAPFVSGVAALLAGAGLDRDEIVDCLKRTSDDLGLPGRDAVFGFGRIDAARAVETC